MFRLVSVFTLVTLLIVTIGCTQIRHISTEEALGKDKKRIASVIFPVFIKSITSLTDQEIPFDSSGGKYDHKNGMISGINNNGESSSTSLTEIKWVQLRESTLSGTKSKLMDTKSFLNRVQLDSWDLKSETSMQPGDILLFNEFGGYYDSQKNVIVGVTKSNIRVKLDPTNLYSIGYKRFSVTKSLLAIAGIGAASLVVLVISARTSSDGIWD